MAHLYRDNKQAERYTLRGDEEVELRIAADMARAVELLMEKFADFDLRAIVLLGGYGRGEGGALMGNGESKPHNNYDFLMVTGRIPASRRKGLPGRVSEAGQTLAGFFQIGVDLNLRTLGNLKNAPNTMIHRDLRASHKILWGAPETLRAMPDYEGTAMPLIEGSMLLRNRGTLLLLNRIALADHKAKREEDRAVFIRHMFKAIIGYGDAVLLAKGAYTTSYAEKLKRISSLSMDDVPQASVLRILYRDAAEFRFQPVYEKYRNRDLAEWLDDLVGVLEPVHLWFERQRLRRPQMTWRDYFFLLYGPGFGVSYGPLKIARNVLLNLWTFGLFGILGDRGWWYAQHPRDRLLAAFPALTYSHKEWEALRDVQALFGVGGDWRAAAERYTQIYNRHLRA